MNDRPIIVESTTEVNPETGDIRITSVERPMTDDEIIGHQVIRAAIVERTANIAATEQSRADALAVVEHFARMDSDIGKLASALLTILPRA